MDSPSASPETLSRHQKTNRRYWKNFYQYLLNHRPPISILSCNGTHVLEYLRHLDPSGKTKVHTQICPFFGNPNPPDPCPCPLRQSWRSLDDLVRRLQAAYKKNVDTLNSNPFSEQTVVLYLRQFRDSQSKALGISYKRKNKPRNLVAECKRCKELMGSDPNEFIDNDDELTPVESANTSDFGANLAEIEIIQEKVPPFREIVSPISSRRKMKLREMNEQILEKDQIIGIYEKEKMCFNEKVEELQREIQDLKGCKLVADQRIAEMKQERLEANHKVEQLEKEIQDLKGHKLVADQRIEEMKREQWQWFRE